MEELLQFVARHWILSLTFIGLLAALLASEFSHFTRRFRSVSPAEATRLINRENAAVLDVSGATEFEASHIVDARNIPAGQLADRHKELKKVQNRPLIVYCRNGQQSEKACTRLSGMGVEPLYWLKGGLAAWQGENLPVVRGRR